MQSPQLIAINKSFYKITKNGKFYEEMKGFGHKMEILNQAHWML